MTTNGKDQTQPYTPYSGEIHSMHHSAHRPSRYTVGDGRGFVVTTPQQWLVADPSGTGKLMPLLDHVPRIVTAAHCLPPPLRPCFSASYTEERTYINLIGPLGEAPTVWGRVPVRRSDR